MLSALILLQLLIPPSSQFFFGGAGGGGGGCGCPCPVPPPVPICAPPPICAQPAPCSSPSYAQPTSYPPIPPIPPTLPTRLPIPHRHSINPVGLPPLPIPLPTLPLRPRSSSLPLLPTWLRSPRPSTRWLNPSGARIAIVTSIATTASYQQIGYSPATSIYEKQYDEENSLEGMAPPPPPPPPVDPPKEPIPVPITYDYRTSEVMTPTGYYKPAYVPNYIEDASEEGPLVEKQGYWAKGPPIPYSSSKYDQFENRHNILKRMKTESIPRTNNTCNSIKLANVMMRAIVQDVTVSKRMIQHATKLAFDGAKFDVFCAIGEFSYSIHSRKYCEVTKEEVTCFAFR
ncbi:unnamed protein product [Caenorhabditis sp. 36 PRJEB53466]|nr:unnamed protein product [Caenorhabditis sp. 36 PRJEB53466]